MKILWFTWKDSKNPLSGGAEIVNEALAKRLAQNGHEVIFLVSGFNEGIKEENIDGYKIIRLGNKWTVYWKSYIYYKNNLMGWADLVIDEVNTIPFFAKFYVKEKNILFFHQLCREIWFYEIYFPLNIIGYLIEPFYLWLLSNNQVITISESTKNDLIKYGFRKNNINIISEGINLKPIESLSNIKKFTNNTLLSFGSIRPMKRTIDILKAYEIVREKMNNIKLIIAGKTNSIYGKKLIKLLNNSKYKKDITYIEKTSIEEKAELMRKSHIFLITSVKEGWGLVITEANSQGTPAIAYDADGIRDSIKNDETGIICNNNNPMALSDTIIDLFKNEKKYEELRQKAWEFSQKISFENSYRDFLNTIHKI